MRTHLKDSKRIVIKIGSSTITKENGYLNSKTLSQIINSVALLHSKGVEVVIVTSGAIASGLGVLNINEKPTNMSKKQAIASVGQISLIHFYKNMFLEERIAIGQMLLTKSDIFDEVRRKNIRETFEASFKYGIVPIINENDVICSEEIRVGDNDLLSAYVATTIKADLLIILSDIEGLYDKSPKLYEDAVLINEINEINESIYNMCGGTDGCKGTGGMITKIGAAKICLDKNVAMVIADGSIEDVVLKVVKGLDIGTIFLKG